MGACIAKQTDEIPIYFDKYREWAETQGKLYSKSRNIPPHEWPDIKNEALVGLNEAVSSLNCPHNDKEFKAFAALVIRRTITAYYRETTKCRRKGKLEIAREPVEWHPLYVYDHSYSEVDSKDELRWLMEGMVDRMAQSFKLRLEGLEPDEIAYYMNIGRNAVNSYATRGFKYMREKLENHNNR